MDPTYVVMPVLSNPELTEAAIADVLAQSVPIRLLIVNQGVDEAFRERLEQIAESEPERILVWHHCPPLPSLSATWNRALRFVWECGGTEALVVNADVRLAPQTVEYLLRALKETEALFVSAVAVAPEQFSQTLPTSDWTSRGGPDFSCFLISKDCHQIVQFDERHIPAYAEDLTFHREMLLGGVGSLIFSVNVPYLHVGGGSGTLKSLPPDQRTALERRIDGSRAYYREAWGGPPNAERYAVKGDPSSDRDGVTTPELQRQSLSGESLGGVDSNATLGSRALC